MNFKFLKFYTGELKALSLRQNIGYIFFTIWSVVMATNELMTNSFFLYFFCLKILKSSYNLTFRSLQELWFELPNVFEFSSVFWQARTTSVHSSDADEYLTGYDLVLRQQDAPRHKYLEIFLHEKVTQ